MSQSNREAGQSIGVLICLAELGHRAELRWMRRCRQRLDGPMTRLRHDLLAVLEFWQLEMEKGGNRREYYPLSLACSNNGRKQ
jgi:hypothetical protein